MLSCTRSSVWFYFVIFSISKCEFTVGKKPIEFVQLDLYSHLVHIITDSASDEQDMWGGLHARLYHDGCWFFVSIACRDDQFRCRDTGECIAAALQYCNRFNDCSDFSDEPPNCSQCTAM